MRAKAIRGGGQGFIARLGGAGEGATRLRSINSPQSWNDGTASRQRYGLEPYAMDRFQQPEPGVGYLRCRQLRLEETISKAEKLVAEEDRQGRVVKDGKHRPAVTHQGAQRREHPELMDPVEMGDQFIEQQDGRFRATAGA
jgi:hypothetical protein